MNSEKKKKGGTAAAEEGESAHVLPAFFSFLFFFFLFSPISQRHLVPHQPHRVGAVSDHVRGNATQL